MLHNSINNSFLSTELTVSSPDDHMFVSLSQQKKTEEMFIEAMRIYHVNKALFDKYDNVCQTYFRTTNESDLEERLVLVDVIEERLMPIYQKLRSLLKASEEHCSQSQIILKEIENTYKKNNELFYQKSLLYGNYLVLDKQYLSMITPSFLKAYSHYKSDFSKIKVENNTLNQSSEEKKKNKNKESMIKNNSISSAIFKQAMRLYDKNKNSLHLFDELIEDYLNNNDGTDYYVRVLDLIEDLVNKVRPIYEELLHFFCSIVHEREDAMEIYKEMMMIEKNNQEVMQEKKDSVTHQESLTGAPKKYISLTGPVFTKIHEEYIKSLSITKYENIENEEAIQDIDEEYESIRKEYNNMKEEHKNIEKKCEMKEEDEIIIEDFKSEILNIFRYCKTEKAQKCLVEMLSLIMNFSKEKEINDDEVAKKILELEPYKKQSFIKMIKFVKFKEKTLQCLLEILEIVKNFSEKREQQYQFKILKKILEIESYKMQVLIEEPFDPYEFFKLAFICKDIKDTVIDSMLEKVRDMRNNEFKNSQSQKTIEKNLVLVSGAYQYRRGFFSPSHTFQYSKNLTNFLHVHSDEVRSSLNVGLKKKSIRSL